MRFLSLTLPTLAENLALDEALLDEAEDAGSPLESLRVWESPQQGVIVGRSSRLTDEVDLDACRDREVLVGRRSSGGCSVMIGPGCWMYAAVLSYELHPELQAIDLAHRFVLDRLATALRDQIPDVATAGTSDLTWNGRKFSGNSLRCKRTHLLYHGTILYRFPLDTIAACLRRPPREPDYRESRSHRDFLVNLPIEPRKLTASLRIAFDADEEVLTPNERVQRLVIERYGRKDWLHSR